MIFKKFKIEDINIVEYRSEGKGFPLVFIHDNSLGAASFYKQMMSKAGEKYQFIALDLPGHGASCISSNPDQHYTFQNLAILISSWLKAIQLGPFALVGHGLGGHIALRCQAYLPNLSAIILQGFSPCQSYKKLLPSHSESAANLLYKAQLSEEESSRLAQLFVNPKPQADIMFVDNIKNTDGRFRQQMLNNLQTDTYNELKAIKNSPIPITLINGGKDLLINSQQIESPNIQSLFYEQKIYTVSDAGHSPMWEKPEVFNFFLDNFLQKITDY